MRAAPMRLSVVMVISLGLLALVIGVILFLRPGNGDATPMFLELPEHLDFEGGTWCDEELPVCVTAESLAAGYALYPQDPHSFAGGRSCPVHWLPDFDLAKLSRPDLGHGAFRAPCAGSTFSRTGERLFGPAPRDLDRWQLIEHDGHLEVDLRVRVCGPGRDEPAWRGGCVPADSADPGN